MRVRKRVLFTGHAPVHVVCFLPVYRRLVEDPSIEVWLSGGFRCERAPGRVEHVLGGLYDPFPVDRARVIPIERARDEEFDVLVSADLSGELFPGAVSHAVQIFDGASFKNRCVDARAMAFDTVCLPGRYHAEALLRHGLVRRGGPNVLVTGVPKCDPLLHRQVDRAPVCDLGLELGRPTVLFAPTGEKGNALEVMGVEAIHAIQRSGRYNLLVKPHDHPSRAINWFAELASLEGRRTRLVRSRDVVPYLRAADVLVTDASSVAYEFALLDRPIVFLDVPRMLDDLATRAPALDLETHARTIGRVVADPADLVAAIDEGVRNPERLGRRRRMAALHIFHALGGATRRVERVVRWAAGLGPLPRDAEVIQDRSTGGAGGPVARWGSDAPGCEQ